MITKIKTAHEEEYSDGSKIIGVLINYDDENKIIDSFTYIYNKNDEVFNGMYVFFNTIMDMNDYIMYSSKTIKRAYMKEDEFDVLYDDGFDGSFSDQLKWINT